MALFKVNTGTREQEVCRLQWEWKVTTTRWEIEKPIDAAEHVCVAGAHNVPPLTLLK